MKREFTPEQAFNAWRDKKGLGYKTFDDVLFDLLAKANLDQTEKLRTIYPEHVQAFEDFYTKAG
jgi:hypothetical protein